MSKLKEKDICPLFYGGSCPSSAYDYEYNEISYKELKRMDKECCQSHREMTKQELNKYMNNKGD